MAAVPVAIERAALRIKIDASVTDGTLATSRITDSAHHRVRDHAAADPGPSKNSCRWTAPTARCPVSSR